MTRLAPLSGGSLRETLHAVLDRVMPACAEVEYRLVGTGAALLHGVPLPAADVDLLMKGRSGVDAFGAALVAFEHRLAPTHLEEAKQYYAELDVDGVEVALSTVEWESDSDAIETFGLGPGKHFVPLPCDGHVVPTVALELRLATEAARGRADRYEPLLDHLTAHGSDLDLVRRGLIAREVPEP